jgi:hypothetical protein
MTTSDDAPQFPEMRRRGFFDDLAPDIFPELESVDHKAEAAAWIRQVERPDMPVDVTIALATLAQANATLALVEQQRIANQIAYLNAHPGIPSAVVRARIEKDLGL